MQDGKNAQDLDPQKVHDAIEKLSHAQNAEEFMEDSELIGKALIRDLKLSEANLSAKAIHFKGLLASRKFEDFVRDHFENVQHFERFHNEYLGHLTYDVILPRIIFSNLKTPDVMQEFASILGEAIDIDISTEKENPALEGMIYLDVTFPTILRIEKE